MCLHMILDSRFGCGSVHSFGFAVIDNEHGQHYQTVRKACLALKQDLLYGRISIPLCVGVLPLEAWY